MRARNVCATAVLGLTVLLMPRPAAAQSSLILQYMKKDPTIQKYMDLGIRGNSFRMRWKHPVAQKIAKTCSQTSYLYCKHAWDAFDGKPMKGSRDFVKGTMEIGKWGAKGTYWTWKFQYYKSGIGPRSMLGSVVWGVPNAAKYIAHTMDKPEKIKKLHSGSNHEPMQAMWYLGAKQYTDTIVNSLSHWYYASHRSFALYFLWNWKLTKAQIKKVETVCINKVFKATRSEDKRSIRACTLFLSRTKTRNKKAKAYLENLIESRDGGVWAIRAAGYMKYKGVKKDLQKMLKKGESWKYHYKKRRRRSKRVKMTTWNGYGSGAAVAVALVGMGDRKALKAIKYFASYDKAKKRLMDTTAFENLAYEVGFANPKARKKITKILLKTLKKLEKDDKRGNLRYKRAVIIGLAQAGAKKVMKSLLSELRGRDQRGLITILKGIGGAKRLWDDSQRGLVGITIGKGAFSVKDAKKIAKYIRGRLEFYNDSGAKRFAIQAILDIEARIKAAKK